MKKILFMAAGFCLISATACNSSEETETDETMVKDSMGVTMPPVTDQIDSAALDTLGTIQPESPVSSPQPSEVSPNPGVQTTSENFQSADGQKLNVVYNNNGQMAVATITINGEEIKLMQTEAWAKGAEYSNGKIKWRAEGSNATLTKDGKETRFALRK